MPLARKRVFFLLPEQYVVIERKLMKNGPILIVDDDETILKTVSLILKQSGYDVDTAKTGAEALEKCKDQIYALLLLDLVLTDTDGMELISRIEDTDPGKNPRHLIIF